MPISDQMLRELFEQLLKEIDADNLTSDLRDNLSNVRDALDTNFRQHRQLNRLDRERIRQNIEHAETIDELIDAVNKETKSKSRLVDGARKFERKVDSLTRTVANTTVNLSNMGDSVTASTRVLSSMASMVPFIGGGVASFMDQIASITEETYKSFNTVAQVGATFGGNLEELRRTVSDTGITLDQYAGVVSRSSANLAFWDGGVREGSQALAEMSGEIRDMVMGDSPLARLGYSLEATAELVANYGGITQRLSSRQLRDDRNLADAAREYAMQLSAISRLTGKSVEELQREADARMADAQFRTMAAKMNEEDAAALNAFLSTLPEGMQTAVKDILATGTATTEQGERLMALMPGLVDQVMDMRRAIHSGETLSEDRLADVYEAAESEAKQLRESPLLDTLGLFVREFDDLVLGILDVSAREITFREALRQVLEDLDNENEDTLAVDIAGTMARLAQASEKLRLVFMQFSESLISLNSWMAETIGGTAEWIIEKINEIRRRLDDGESFTGIIWDGLTTELTTWWTKSLNDLKDKFDDFISNFENMLRDVLPPIFLRRNRGESEEGSNTPNSTGFYLGQPDSHTSRSQRIPPDMPSVVSDMTDGDIRREIEGIDSELMLLMSQFGDLFVDDSDEGIEIGEMFARRKELESALGDAAPRRPDWLDEFLKELREDIGENTPEAALHLVYHNLLKDFSTLLTTADENLDESFNETLEYMNKERNRLRDEGWSNDNQRMLFGTVEVLERILKEQDVEMERRSGSLGESGRLMEDFGSIESGDFLRDLSNNLDKIKINPQEFAEQIKQAVPDADINIQATAQQEPDTTATAQAAMTTEQFNKMNRNLEIIAQLLGRQLDVEQRTLTATQDNVRDSFFAT